MALIAISRSVLFVFFIILFISDEIVGVPPRGRHGEPDAYTVALFAVAEHNKQAKTSYTLDHTLYEGTMINEDAFIYDIRIAVKDLKNNRAGIKKYDTKVRIKTTGANANKMKLESFEELIPKSTPGTSTSGSAHKNH
ncbi:hypothetical protein CASFOL_013140 [Castilleja foliolosa]|uniref:Cysteine proteinase inhibitor n=1 Tax=Castilleja foliolosa TaxID=1961234 RepID=A0ABD3DN94_9LAMI